MNRSAFASVVALGFILSPAPLMADDAPAQHDAAVASDDTSLTVAIVDGKPVVKSLRSQADGFDWVGGERLPLPLIDSVEIQDKRRRVEWRFVPDAREAQARSAARSLRFVSDDPPLELQCELQPAAGPGPVELRINITNRGSADVLLPVQSSWDSALRAPAGHAIEQWWVDKGAGTPTADGVHRKRLEPGSESLLRCWPSGRDDPRDPIPWSAIQDVDGNRGVYIGVEYTARVQIVLSATPPAGHAASGADVRMRLRVGLQPDPAAPYLTRITPGETFEAPPVFIGCYHGDVDDGANRLRRWVRAAVVPPTDDPRYPLLVNNSWGGGMAVDEAMSHRMIDDAAGLGLEMFHIDAGWFKWVGDWTADAKKFPAGLAPVADYAHGKGLKFGLWVGWTQGGDRVDPTGGHRILSVNDPAMTPWFCQKYPSNWKPSDFTGATVCLGEPAAVDWCLNTLRPLIKEAKLDMLEHDQTMVSDGCQQNGHLHTATRTDAGFRAAQGYYRVYDSLRKEHPSLLFENCVNGGHMIDYGALRRCHYISITDTYDPLSNRRAFYDASYALPPAACECYIQNMPVKDPAQFRFMLRSGMMGWCTIMADTNQWTAEQHEIARREFANYKQFLRPLIQKADLYHVLPRPDGKSWDGIEYFDVESGKGAVYVFRGNNERAEQDVPIRGLDRSAKYALTWQDGSSPPTIAGGEQLMAAGVRARLAEPGTCDILRIVRQ